MKNYKNSSRKLLLLLFTAILLTFSTEAAVKLPRLVSDGMVLQRNTPINIWGWASPGENVTVTFNGKTYSTVTGYDEKWSVKLPKQPAGGPYNITVNDLTIKNVLIGDVWLCSGQSNMVLPINRVLDLYRGEVKDVNIPNIRHFNLSTEYSFTVKLEDLTSGEWKAVTPENVLDFGAVAYFFSLDLYNKYKVPIGIINASVGGTPIQAWISKEALKPFPESIAQADQCAVPGYMDSVKKGDRLAGAKWDKELDKKDPGVANRWGVNSSSVDGWGSMKVPGYWYDNGFSNVNGSFWFRRNFDVPADMAGKPAVIRLGCIVDADSTFVNGVFVGRTTYRYPPRIYNIPAGVLTSGANIVTVRVVNSGGAGGGFIEDKLYRIEIGVRDIDLAGDWQFKQGAAISPAPGQTTFHYMPTGLYNGMIYPIVPMAIKGVVWYQGESNSSKYEEYGELLSTLIANWRSDYRAPNLPFILIQLPNYMKSYASPTDGNWPRFRETQLKALAIPNTAMAVTIDIGEWNDIHPLNKKDVGHRAALAAMKLAYGDKKVIASAPVYKSMAVDGNKIVLSFSEIGNGFAAEENLQGFAIAGADERFYWANAKIEGDKVVVWSNNVDNPVAVRYAWADNPVGANLRNKEGLPSSPFRTDNWGK